MWRGDKSRMGEEYKVPVNGDNPNNFPARFLKLSHSSYSVVLGREQLGIVGKTIILTFPSKFSICNFFMLLKYVFDSLHKSTIRTLHQTIKLMRKMIYIEIFYFRSLCRWRNGDSEQIAGTQS